jgi:DNA-binding beta-propeller fold protein YncE
MIRATCTTVALWLLLGACGSPQPPPPRDLDAFDAPAPRQIVFAGAYENRRSEPYAPLVRPSCVTVLPDNRFLFADYGSARLHVFDHRGEWVTEGDQLTGGGLPLDLDTYGFLVYLLDAGQRRILRYTEEGVYRDVLLAIQVLDPVSRIEPSAMAVDRDGRVAVCDVAGHRVLLTGPFMDLETVVGEFGSFEGQFHEPRGVAFGLSGMLYVSDRGNRRVQVFDRTGQVLDATRSIGGVDSLFVAPSGMDTDRWGNVYVTDAVRGVVVVLAPDLFPLAVLGEDSFADDHLVSPVDCAVGSDDRLYVVDAGRQALLVYDIVFP